LSPRDDIFQHGGGEPGSFVFDERVAAVFPDMIGRSVPGYALMVAMIGQLARRHAVANTVIHDLGSSLGAATLSMRERVDAVGVRIVATDNAPAMVAGLEERLQHLPAGISVSVQCGDVQDVDFHNSSVVVLNFTLQFVPPHQRLELLQRIQAGLVPGGVLVLSEKICLEQPAEQQRQTDWHLDFKRLQGYSELEIARKRSALEKVLEPETEATHQQRLREAGFARSTRWFQCFGFCSYLAEK
jgi:tRNA (cmo5U34)-methyltransferase